MITIIRLTILLFLYDFKYMNTIQEILMKISNNAILKDKVILFFMEYDVVYVEINDAKNAANPVKIHPAANITQSS